MKLLEIKWKHDPDSIYFKAWIWRGVSLHKNQSKCGEWKKISELESPEFHIVLLDLKYCYENKTPISDTKNKKDMLALCKDGTTPEEYHSYYNNTPSYSSVEDVVPEPDLYHEMDDE